MSTRKLVYFTNDEQPAALIRLCAALGWAGQRGPGLSPFMQELGDIAASAPQELVAALEIARECALGGDWHELIESEKIRPQWSE